MKDFNNWIALKITQGVATMWAAYGFGILAILGFPYQSLSLTTGIQWLSQTFIQLTMLAVIMVGQKVLEEQNNKTHQHHERLHENVRKILERGE